MSVQAPAIGGVSARETGAAAATVNWLRGIGVRQVRLACGLVMFSYIFSHFFNHALGNVSYALMEKWLTFHIWWWRIPAVNVTLYGAAAIHFSLGLWALYARRHFRYTIAEITQLLLGLSIPLWLASHFGVVRVAGWVLGRDPVNYAAPLFAYWVARPHMIAVQFALLTVAWTHACIGLYFWLRMKPFFKWAAPILLAVAVLLPPLAMIGAHHGAEEVIALAKDPQWRADHINTMPTPQRALIDDITLFYFPIGYAAALVLVFVARRAQLTRTPRWHGHDLLSRQAGSCPERFKRFGSELAIQGPPCQRLRRPRALLHMPRSRSRRSHQPAAPVPPRSLRARSGRRRRSVDPAGLSATAANRHCRYSDLAAACRCGVRPQSPPYQYRRGALHRQHVR
jgi:hypothetical protein